MQIGRKDVLWSYAATFLQIGAGVILLPFILREFPQETVAIWTIFATIIALSSMLDFGFNPSFARNVSYVVSGVKELKKTGFQIVENTNCDVDYGLFKGLINAMRWFYGRVALILFVLLISLGTFYIYTILRTYSHSHTEVYIAWAILCIINSYSLYTLYYDSLLQGQGLVKKAKQIQIVGQSVYLLVAIVMILLQFNLIAVVSAQALSVIIRRLLSYKTIYTAKFKQLLRGVIAQSRKEILRMIYPNAVKLGLTGLGGFLVTQSSIIMGSLYLSLNDMASYGITMQIVGIISAIAVVYGGAYTPKIAQFRTYNDSNSIKQIYLKGCLLLLGTFLVSGLMLALFGNQIFVLIGSQTPLLSTSPMILILLTSLLVTNHAFAAGILLSKNYVPFFKPSIISGLCVVIGLFLVLKHTNLGLVGLIIVPLLVNVSYQSWKWPWEVIKDLKLYKI
jgi:O-antigen/teichoic acid export membrane protein